MVDDRLPGKKKLSISALFFPVLKSGSQKLIQRFAKMASFPKHHFHFLCETPIFLIWTSEKIRSCSWRSFLQISCSSDKRSHPGPEFPDGQDPWTLTSFEGKHRIPIWQGPLNFENCWRVNTNTTTVSPFIHVSVNTTRVGNVWQWFVSALF